jgi:hypothetical protein
LTENRVQKSGATGLKVGGWFDDLYDDVIVGQSNVWLKDGKIKIQNGNTHEFRIGEYQCEQIRTTD